MQDSDIKQLLKQYPPDFNMVKQYIDHKRSISKDGEVSLELGKKQQAKFGDILDREKEKKA
eukprot:CAMPEP_0170561010 /NCGR_PEP_ID=MMETSP0211-20121228/52253_1 /TAXON_ID=311385 /ORGANISM="Pseudokeronopsis sp., Strain OXSARD2" /LENGTH=60 /DNA_ID=CAMNT_0010875995 /DNA_START=106 /DNA_END=284 /DNA_ORIENTATION=-